MNFGDERLPARIWKKVVVNGECWEWTGCKVFGYGTCSFMGEAMRVHRVVLLASGVALNDQLVVDHMCRNRACLNPKHLQQVTTRENVLAGIGPTAKNAKKETCKYGHPLSGKNLYVRPSRPTERECVICRHRAHMWHDAIRPSRSKKVRS